MPSNLLGRSSASAQSFLPIQSCAPSRCGIWRPRGRPRAAGPARSNGSRRRGGRITHGRLDQRRTLLRGERLYFTRTRRARYVLWRPHGLRKNAEGPQYMIRRSMRVQQVACLPAEIFDLSSDTAEASEYFRSKLLPVLVGEGARSWSDGRGIKYCSR